MPIGSVERAVMNERVKLCHRMLSEAEKRIDEFNKTLESESRRRTTELRRPLDLIGTSQRDMDWIIENSSLFKLPYACVDQAEELKPIIRNLMKAIYAQITENQTQRSGGKKVSHESHVLAISMEGNGILTLSEVERIDALIMLLEEAPPVDYASLWERTKEQRLSEIDKIFSGGLSFGEVTNAHPILNQPEEDFHSALKAIDNNIIEQIKIVEHYLPRWFSMGEFPPPYYAWRIVVILRKAKEHGREQKFLRAYLINFRSRFGGSRTNEKLVERAEKMGVVLPPVS
jgi:hypothetical protein